MSCPFTQVLLYASDQLTVRLTSVLIVGDWTCSILLVGVCDMLSCWCINHLLYYFRWLLTGILDVFGIVYIYWLEIRYLYSKTCVKRTLQKRQKNGFQDQSSLNAGQSIAECSKGGILQYFQPSLSYQLLLRSLFCLFLSGHFTHILLYQESAYRCMCT